MVWILNGVHNLDHSTTRNTYHLNTLLACYADLHWARNILIVCVLKVIISVVITEMGLIICIWVKHLIMTLFMVLWHWPPQHWPTRHWPPFEKRHWPPDDIDLTNVNVGEVNVIAPYLWRSVFLFPLLSASGIGSYSVRVTAPYLTFLFYELQNYTAHLFVDRVSYFS